MAINELGMEIKEYTLLDEKEHDAVIFGIINLGLQEGKEYDGKATAAKTAIRLILELPSEVNEEGEAATVQKKINITGNVEKGNYAKLLIALGEKVNKNNINSYLSPAALQGLLGKSVVAKVEHFETTDGKRNMVSELTKLDPRLPQPKGTRHTFFFNPFKPDLEVFKNDLTSYGQKEVMAALNSDNFPAELHEAWAEIQENQAKEKAGKVAKGVTRTNTSSIE